MKCLLSPGPHPPPLSQWERGVCRQLGPHPQPLAQRECGECPSPPAPPPVGEGVLLLAPPLSRKGREDDCRSFPDGQDFGNLALLFPSQCPYPPIDHPLSLRNRGVASSGYTHARITARPAAANVLVPAHCQSPRGILATGPARAWKIRLAEEQVLAVVELWPRSRWPSASSAPRCKSPGAKNDRRRRCKLVFSDRPGMLVVGV